MSSKQDNTGKRKERESPAKVSDQKLSEDNIEKQQKKPRNNFDPTSSEEEELYDRPRTPSGNLITGSVQQVRTIFLS